MARITRLTESDLNRLVKKIINEQVDNKQQNKNSEIDLIRKNKIKEGTSMSSIFTTNMGGLRINNDNEFIFYTTCFGTQSCKNTVKKEISYSVDSGEFKPIRKDYEFAKLLDGRSEFNNVNNAIKILNDKVRYRTATKQGNTYTFKSKDGQKNVTVKPSYFITTEGVSPQRWSLIKTDVNDSINDINFIKKFNDRRPFN